MKATPTSSPEPIGVYDHPPPSSAGPAVKSVQLRKNFGADFLLLKATSARDWTYKIANEILGGL